MKLQEYLAKPNKTIAEHAQDLIRQAEILWDFHYINDKYIFDLLCQACLHHDDGKANKEFQKRVRNGKLKFNPEKEVPHNILSIFYLDPSFYLHSSKYQYEDFMRVACAILYHHDYCEEWKVLREKRDLIDSLLLDEYKHEFDDENELVGIYPSDPQTILLKGLLHRCDYSASGNYQVEYPNDFLIKGLDQMMQAWKVKNPKSKWNELQEFCIEHREDDIIALAPTGMGKTEAGLHWIGDNKGFFVLPVRVAINSIYDRVKNDILKEEKLHERLGLLHSEALEYYREHLSNSEELDIFEYSDRGKILSLPLNISTLDQLFGFIFGYKGYEMKLVTLAYSKIVIDEIQMYDAELLAYLVFGLRKIHQFGGKIAIVTATLSPFLKDILRRDTGIEFKEQQFSNNLMRHSIKVKQESLSAEDIIQCYKKNKMLNHSNKILVVCNTIRKAQEMYDELKEADIDLNLNVFHSRFTRNDRKQLESEIKEFGKTYSDEKQGVLDSRDGIWIATSVVEVSLDIDFDYLFTELSELNALFQRMGRCNRKGKKDIDEYNCFVYCDGKDVKRGRKGFLDAVLYTQSMKALSNCDGPISEEDKLALIEKYFTTEAVSESDYLKEYNETFNKFKIGVKVSDGEQDLRNIFSQNIVPKSVYLDYKESIEGLQKNLMDVEKQIQEEKKLGKYKLILNNLWKRRLEIQEQLKGYIVSIPKYMYIKYKRHEIEIFGEIKINRFETIPVIDCHYDEKGFYPLDVEEMDEPIFTL